MVHFVKQRCSEARYKALFMGRYGVDRSETKGSITLHTYQIASTYHRARPEGNSAEL
jgi:hypothetical protein